MLEGVDVLAQREPDPAAFRPQARLLLLEFLDRLGRLR